MLSRNGLATIDLDGGGYREISTSPPAMAPGPEWRPDGVALLSLIGRSGEPSVLASVALDGMAAPMYPPQPSFDSFSVPGLPRSFAYSRDGNWLYLTGNNCNNNGILYRYRVGSNGLLQRLSPPTSDVGQLCFGTVQLSPSPSPDGTRLVFENDSTYFSGFTLRVMDLATLAVTPLKVEGRQPRWSPDGTLITYWWSERLWVVRPDGSSARPVTPANRFYAPGATWSPDSKYLLATAKLDAFATDRWVVVDVATGEEISLPFSLFRGWGAPAWRPTN
jgi:hypothetical protein